MKKWILLLPLLISQSALWSQTIVDAIIAVVGKEIILQSELEERYTEHTAQYAVVDNIEEERCAVLGQMIFTKLMVHQADLDSIVITEDMIDDQINYRVALLLQQVGGDAKIIENYFGKSMSEIKEDMRDLTRESLVSEQVQMTITDPVTITPSEVKKFANAIGLDSMPIIETSYEFGHIVKIPTVSEEEIVGIREELESFRERVLRGERFAMLARLYSDDPGSASKGGELGFVERGTLYPEFEAVAFSLKTGEISRVVQTQAGYHIIQMIERRGETINVAHILLQPKPSPEEQVKAIEYLDSVRQVILSEKIDFSEAAKMYSSDGSKNSGGWVVNPYTGAFKFDKESIEPATFATLDKLIEGEYSTAIPFVNDEGIMAYRLVYLKSKNLAHKANLDEDYDVIKNAALEEKKEKAIVKWISNKVKVTSIELYDEYKNCSFVTEWGIPN